MFILQSVHGRSHNWLLFVWYLTNHGFYTCLLQPFLTREGSFFNRFSIHFFNTLCRQVDTKQFTEYENVKGNLLMQVIPVEPNKEKLEQVPHKTIEDIAVELYERS